MDKTCSLSDQNEEHADFIHCTGIYPLDRVIRSSFNRAQNYGVVNTESELAMNLATFVVPEVVGSNPTGVRDFFSFSVWAHFLSRAIAQKVLFGIFIRAL